MNNSQNYTSVELDPVEADAIPLSEVTEFAQDFKKKSVHGALSYMLRSAFLNLFAIVTNLVLGYYLLPSDFGVYILVAQIIGILQFFSSIGLGPTLIQKNPSQH